MQEKEIGFLNLKGESLIYPSCETMDSTLECELRERLLAANNSDSTGSLRDQENLVILDRKNQNLLQHEKFCFDKDCSLDCHQIRFADTVEAEWFGNDLNPEKWDPSIKPDDWKTLIPKMPNLIRLYIDVEKMEDISNAVFHMLKIHSGWQIIRVKQLCIVPEVWKEIRGNMRSLEYLHCKSIDEVSAADLTRTCTKLKVLRADGSAFCDHKSLPDGVLFVTSMTSDLSFKRRDLNRGYIKKLDSLEDLCLSAPPAESVTPPFGQTFMEHMEYVSMLHKNKWHNGLKRFCPSRISDEDVPKIVELCPNLHHLFLWNTTINDHTLNVILQLRKLQTMRLSILPPACGASAEGSVVGVNASDSGNQDGDTRLGVSFGGLMLFLKYAFHKDRHMRSVHLFSRYSLSHQQLLEMQTWSDQADLDSIELVIHGDADRLVPLPIETLSGPQSETTIDGIVMTSMHSKVTSRAHSPALPRKKVSFPRRVRNIVVKTLSTICPTNNKEK